MNRLKFLGLSGMFAKGSQPFCVFVFFYVIICFKFWLYIKVSLSNKIVLRVCLKNSS